MSSLFAPREDVTLFPALDLAVIFRPQRLVLPSLSPHCACIIHDFGQDMATGAPVHVPPNLA